VLSEDAFEGEAEAEGILQLADSLTVGAPIAILELHPLLHPERYAVAYDPASLQDILMAGGFLADSAPVPLRGSGVTAHCTVAKRRRKEVPADITTLQNAVEIAWDRIRLRALSAYAADLAPKDLASYQRLVSTLTTIASIEAWRSGRGFLP